MYLVGLWKFSERGILLIRCGFILVICSQERNKFTYFNEEVVGEIVGDYEVDDEAQVLGVFAN